MTTTNNAYSATSDRSRGWLRYLYRKATTPDNWDKNGHPHPHWDGTTGEPMLSWHRFDLIESSYAMALMADTTPAWREIYSTILDELASRYTSYWAAKDWLDQLGPDPRRNNYPEGWHKLIPSHLRGEYDVPGWTANGVEPWGMQMDPVGANSNLFFKGWFLVILGLYRYVSGDDTWNQPFDMIRDGEHTFTWSHSEIARHLTEQWSRRPEGCH
jgi:hypothetical protein